MKHIARLVLIVALAITAGACSGDDNGSTPAPSPSPVPSPSPTPSPSPAPPQAGCTASVTGVPSPLPWNGGRFDFTITTASGCAWTARTDVSWADVSPGSGNGTVVATLNVAQSLQSDTRTLTLTIGSQSFRYVQSPPTSCVSSLSPASVEVADQGQIITIVITAADGCGWNAASNMSWVRVTPSSGTGSGSVSLDVAANTGGARQAFVTIGNQQVSVTQRAR